MAFVDQSLRSLHRLIYFSRAQGSAVSDMARTMREILAVAVVRNKEADVSGALLACDDWFVQALEGSRLKVGLVYATVCDDPRHHDVRVIEAGPAEARKFADWSMCGQTLSSTDAAIVKVLSTQKKVDPGRLTGASALSLLAIVRDLQTRQPPVAYV